MEIYRASGKTKTGEELRITKPCGGLVISSDKKLSTLKNETISIYIERSNGNNEEIAQNISLLHFILAATYGESAVDTSDGFVAYCEVASNGSIELEENESLRVRLDGLTAANEYALSTMELPIMRSEAIEYDRKVVLDAETNRILTIEDADIAIVEGAESIKEIQFYYDNDVVVKRTLPEMRAMQHDVDPIIGIGVGDNAETVLPSSFPDILIIPVVGVDRIDIEKTTDSALNFTLQNAFELIDEDDLVNENTDQ